MPRATCRCGEELDIPRDGTERIVCPACGARIRVRRGVLRAASPDGYIRFYCPCGRRLKVSASDPPDAGKCPACGRTVPVPSSSTIPLLAPPPGHPDAPTEEMNAADMAMLDEWSAQHLGEGAPTASASSTAIHTSKQTGPVEAGLRVCPGCGRPLHLSAIVCRSCGAPVPKR
jgi:hypothetical protein